MRAQATNRGSATSRPQAATVTGPRRTRDAGTDFSTPTLLRYGVREDWEVRIAPEGYIRQGSARGMGDTAMGVKWHSSDGKPDSVLPAVGWIFHLELPPVDVRTWLR